MSNSAQGSSNPLLRKRGTRDGRVIDAIGAASVGQQNVGTFSKPLPGGVSMIVDKRGRAIRETYPFRCKIRKADGTVQIEQGTINGKSATAYSVNIAATGTQVIYVRVTPTFTDVEDYITGATFANFTILAASAVPADTATDFYRTLATYVDGVKTGQPVRNSLEIIWCGTTAAPNARWGLSG